MKTLCMGILAGVLLFLASLATAAPVTNRTDEAAIIAASVPGVRSIHPTAYGYQVLTTNGVISVGRTSLGLSGPKFEAYRTPTGYSVKTDKARSYSADPHGYQIEGGGRIWRTGTGYDLPGGALSSNRTGYKFERNAARRDTRP